MGTYSDQQAAVDAVPLEEIDVSKPELFENDTWRPWFARLRREALVHYLADSDNGPFWSVTNHHLIPPPHTTTSYHHLIKEVDTNNQVFSSEAGGITIIEPEAHP